MTDDLKRDIKKFLKAAAIFVALFVVFVASAGAIKAGGIHLWAGIINGAVEIYMLVRLVLKYMNNDKI